MKRILIFIAVVVFLSIEPPKKNIAQTPSNAIVTKENRIKKLEQQVDSSQAEMLKKLRQIKPNPVVIYKTRYKPNIVYVTSDNAVTNITQGTRCDTVFYLVKKKNLMQRLFGHQRADTIKVK